MSNDVSRSDRDPARDAILLEADSAVVEQSAAMKKRVAEHLDEARSRMTVAFEQAARCDEPLHFTAAGEHIADDASSVLSTDAVRSNN